MKRIDVSTVPARAGSAYPRPFDAPCSGQSSQRHWHSHEDEFVWVLEIGNSDPQDRCTCPDIDMVAEGVAGYTHRDGTPYPLKE